MFFSVLTRKARPQGTTFTFGPPSPSEGERPQLAASSGIGPQACSTVIAEGARCPGAQLAHDSSGCSDRVEGAGGGRTRSQRLQPGLTRSQEQGWGGFATASGPLGSPSERALESCWTQQPVFWALQLPHWPKAE